MDVSETWGMADGLERGKSESEEISSEKVKMKNSKLLHKGNDDVVEIHNTGKPVGSW